MDGGSKGWPPPTSGFNKEDWGEKKGVGEEYRGKESRGGVGKGGE